MYKAAAGLVAFLLSGACATRPSDGDPPSPESCTELRDHLVSLRLESATGIEPSAHRAALARALGSEFVSTCTATMTVAQVKCAVAADSSADAAACAAQNQQL
jgi:hypothetical protein